MILGVKFGKITYLIIFNQKKILSINHCSMSHYHNDGVYKILHNSDIGRYKIAL